MRVLITGDDGPPSSVSPYVLGLYRELRRKGWDVHAVLPSSQKSWGGMHFAAHNPCAVWYYYPRADNDDGSHPDTPASWSATRRPVRSESDEIGEWVLMDASPASCANAGIFTQHLLFPDDPEKSKPFDLVISGPNYGRNTGTSFALGSGTIGAALAASLARVKAISLSYGHFAVLPRKLREAEARLAPAPPPEPSASDPGKLDASKQQTKKDVPFVVPVAAAAVVQAAHELSVSLIERLWNEWEPEVGVYNINVPLAWTLLEPKVCWTTTWKGKHGRLYDLHQEGSAGSFFAPPKSAGSDLNKDEADARKARHEPHFAPQPQTKLKFSPDIQAMLAPKDLPEGTDVWALMNGWVSVTRLRAAFAEVEEKELGSAAKADTAPGSVWRL